MNIAERVGSACLLVAALLPWQARASWTSKWLGSSTPDGNATLAEGSYPCEGGGTCFVMGVAFSSNGGQLDYGASLDDGQTFSFEKVESGTRSVRVEGQVGLAFAGATPFINYSGSNTSRLWTAKRVGTFGGNCGVDDRWSCVSLDTSVGLHLTSTIDASVLYAVFNGGAAVRIASRPTDYSAGFFFGAFGAVNYFIQAVAVAVDPAGPVLAAWASRDCIYVNTLANITGPADVVECVPRGVVNDENRMGMAVDTSGVAHLVYILKQANGSSVLRHASRATAGGPWQAETVRTFSVSEPGFDPKLVLRANRQGIDAIAWGRERYLANGTTARSLEMAYAHTAPPWASPGGVDGFGGRGGNLVRLHTGRLAVVHYDRVSQRHRLSLEN